MLYLLPKSEKQFSIQFNSKLICLDTMKLLSLMKLELLRSPLKVYVFICICACICLCVGLLKNSGLTRERSFLVFYVCMRICVCVYLCVCVCNPFLILKYILPGLVSLLWGSHICHVDGYIISYSFLNKIIISLGKISKWLWKRGESQCIYITEGNRESSDTNMYGEVGRTF